MVSLSHQSVIAGLSRRVLAPLAALLELLSRLRTVIVRLARFRSARVNLFRFNHFKDFVPPCANFLPSGLRLLMR